MARRERSIKIAFDKSSGEILDADEVFDKTKDAFEIRRQYHEKKLTLTCCECEQDLTVSDSVYDRLYFKHKPYHDFCILTDGSLSPKEQIRFTEILRGKESCRHKELKNKIGQLLAKVDGVDSTSISIDSKFIIRGNEKRRPDVYCKYKDFELVFEIQLSDLSLGYILSRYEFYKKHGIYLIWILDNFDIHNQGTLEKDIKYLTKFENFFKLDENSDTFKVICDYKFPFLTEDNKLLTKWLNKSVSLNQIKFDSESYQVYYYNFGNIKCEIEVEQKRRIEEVEITKRNKKLELKIARAKNKASNIIDEIKVLRTRKSLSFDSVIEKIRELDNTELQIFNNALNLKRGDKTKKPALLQWIYNATLADVYFLEFILSVTEIELDVNEKDSNGKSALTEIYDNKKIVKEIPIESLFKRGYIFTEEDKNYIATLPYGQVENANNIILYSICNNLSNKELVDFIFRNSKLLFIIESAKLKEIIGFNYKETEWIAFANNAIHHYSEYWEYIEIAFKHYGLWDKLIELDKKETFQRKVQTFYSKMPQQKFDFDEVFQELYPELAV